MPTRLSQLAFGPDVAGAIIRGTQGRSAINQVREQDRQRRTRETLDTSLAGGIPADPAQRREIEQNVFRTGGAEAGLQIRELFQGMDAAEREQAAQEGRTVATFLAGVRDQPTYDRARAGLERQGIDISTLPEQFDQGVVTFTVNAARDLEDIIAGQAPPDPVTLGTGDVLVNANTGAEVARGLPAADSGPDATVANQLRDEFVAQTNEFVDVQNAARKVEAAAASDSGPGDIALLVGYMKIIDPGSVVREGEFATAATAGGVGEDIRNLYNRVVSGERLTPELRQRFVQAAEQQFQTYRAGYNQTVDTYSGLAQRFGLDPATVVINRVVGNDAAADNATVSPTAGSDIPTRDMMPAIENMPRPTTQEGYDALPDGAWYIDPDSGQPFQKGR